jgi:hypothetical protein
MSQRHTASDRECDPLSPDISEFALLQDKVCGLVAWYGDQLSSVEAILPDKLIADSRHVTSDMVARSWSPIGEICALA